LGANGDQFIIEDFDISQTPFLIESQLLKAPVTWSNILFNGKFSYHDFRKPTSPSLALVPASLPWDQNPFAAVSN
jgi:hypothetical protein